MAITFTQLNPATSTQGAIVAVDRGDLGTATHVVVQLLKLYYGTEGVFNEPASGSGYPTAVFQWTATGNVNVSSAATLAVVPTSLPTSATLAVVPTSLPTSATLPVVVQNTATVNIAAWGATAFVAVLQGTTSTSPVSVGTWTATGQVLTSPLASATGPVSVGTWTATGIVRIDTHSTATLPVSLASLPTTATLAVAVQNTATVAISGNVNANVGGRWAHDATSTGNPTYVGGIARHSRPTAVADGDVSQIMVDTLGRPVFMPFAPRGDVIEVVPFTISGTGLTTMATAAGTGVYNDMIWMVLTNNATTEARVRIRSTSTATKWSKLNLAAHGGGIAFQPARPAFQAAANGAWDIQLATEIVGQVDVSGEFMRTVT